jgi:hypothetical protein
VLKVRVLSDLHMEFTNYQPAHLESIGEDLVVLAGDIGVGIKGIEWAKTAFAGRRVVYVLGNHEFYNHDWDDLLLQARKAAQGSNVTFMENDAFDIGDLRILGCTLWTDLKSRGAARFEKASFLAQRSMNDFLAIRNRGQKRRVILPNDTVQRCEESHQWLRASIADSDRPLLVVTHHAPTMHGVNPRFRHDLLTSAFHNAFDQLLTPPVVAWVYGHNHYSFDRQIDGVRLVSNQRGYPDEKVNFDWNACWSIDPFACSVTRL